MHDAVRDQHEQSGNAPSSSDTAQVAARDRFPMRNSLGIALDAGQVGVWSWDIKSNAVKWSRNMEQIHGLRSRQF